MNLPKNLLLHDGDVSYVGMPSTREPDTCYADEVNWLEVELVGEDRHLARVTIRSGSSELSWEMSVHSAHVLNNFLGNALCKGCKNGNSG